MMKKDVEIIDLSDYKRTGEGACGASYDKLSDPNLMVKLYNTSYPKEAIYSELEVAQKVFSVGVPSPEPGKLVSDGERLGIAFRKVAGKRSFSRMLADEPERTEEYAREMARMAKQLHKIELPDGMFPDVKEQSLMMLEHVDGFNAEQKEFLRRIIAALPDCNTALHGDFHFGNLVTNLPKGAPLSTPHDSYFIDLGNFTCGCPLLDVAMLVNVCEYSSEEFIFHDMHIHKPQAREALRYFLDEYFFDEDRLVEKWFGPGCTAENIITEMRPYYCVKGIFIAYSIDRVLPETHEALAAEMNKYPRGSYWSKN